MMVFGCRYQSMKEQRDGKSHEAEIIMTRIKQSTHHQQITRVEEVKQAISKSTHTYGGGGGG